MQAEPLPQSSNVNSTPRFDAATVLREIAKPRLTGSAGAAETGAIIRAHFEALGYHVQERLFTFNPWIGRLGLTVFGVIYLIGTFAAAIFLYNNNAIAAIVLLAVVLLLAAGLLFFAGRAMDRFPFAQQQGSNFFITREGKRPRYIVMAHRDSKSQPVPLSFRGPAIALALLVWILLLAAAAFHAAQPLPGKLIIGLGVAAFIAGVILIFCWVENRSPGALDNASGVTAAIGIAERERDEGDVAFLITDAEELGLAGARAAARSLPPVFGVINMDGLDDEGTFYIMERFGVIRKKGLAPHIAAALLQEAEAMNEPADRRDIPFGIPVDHIPIVNAGTPALTIMRGSLRSLRRVHRPNDDLEHLNGTGIQRTVELVSGALKRMRQQV
jgi:hypothetical protein